jgi:ABC-type transport system substrate-binding protein
VRYELPDIAPKITTGTSSDGMKRLFTASLAYMDGSGTMRPYLAETLPAPGTDTWRVFPDGRMETIYKLRSDLTWHDGHILSADDFVFALRVYKSPGTSFDPVPQDRIEEVLAADPRTVVIRWKTLYLEAGALRSGMFEPLPRHILETAIEQQPDEISGLSYWSRDFVQAGPFRLEQWEPGSHMDAIAFDGHALGRPKIDRIIVKFVPDENTMLTALLAESVQMAADNSLRFEHSTVLKREWGPTNKGDSPR